LSFFFPSLFPCERTVGLLAGTPKVGREGFAGDRFAFFFFSLPPFLGFFFGSLRKVGETRQKRRGNGSEGPLFFHLDQGEGMCVLARQKRRPFLFLSPLLFRRRDPAGGDGEQPLVFFFRFLPPPLCWRLDARDNCCAFLSLPTRATRWSVVKNGRGPFISFLLPFPFFFLDAAVGGSSVWEWDKNIGVPSPPPFPPPPPPSSSLLPFFRSRRGQDA